MVQKTSEFMTEWVLENVSFSGYPAEDGTDPEAKALADQCVTEAEAVGISRQKLEDEFGDLPSFMHGELERRADEEVAKQAAKDD